MNITMHRFFIRGMKPEHDEAAISGDTAHQIIRVLRLKPGDQVILLDNEGWEYQAVIKSISNDVVIGRIVNKVLGTGEPSIKITLYQALLKNDKLELVLQKGVELGVHSFVPFISERCVAKKPSESKQQRWHEIIKEAAEQSRRTLIPVLNQVISFEEACSHALKPALILWEEEKTRGLKSFLKSPKFSKKKEISVFVGPEGGFTSAEIGLANQFGIAAVRLGDRILRAETAGLAAVSAIMYEEGELG